MKSFMDKIYYRLEGDGLKPSKEWGDYIEEAAECDEKLTLLLEGNEEAKRLYKSFCDAIGGSHSEEAKSNFRHGFGLGLLLGIEATKICDGE